MYLFTLTYRLLDCNVNTLYHTNISVLVLFINSNFNSLIALLLSAIDIRVNYVMNKTSTCLTKMKLCQLNMFVFFPASKHHVVNQT